MSESQRIAQLEAEIERLRANADSLWQDVQRADEANKQMADEIERLRAENKRMYAELCQGFQDKAQIERLRTLALKFLDEQTEANADALQAACEVRQ